jgi:hypothetical protein
MSLYGSLWAFLVSIAHVALIRKSNFGADMVKIHVTPEKVCDRETIISL